MNLPSSDKRESHYTKREKQGESFSLDSGRVRLLNGDFNWASIVECDLIRLTALFFLSSPSLWGETKEAGSKPI